MFRCVWMCLDVVGCGWMWFDVVRCVWMCWCFQWESAAIRTLWAVINAVERDHLAASGGGGGGRRASRARRVALVRTGAGGSAAVVRRHALERAAQRERGCRPRDDGVTSAHALAGDVRRGGYSARSSGRILTCPVGSTSSPGRRELRRAVAAPRVESTGARAATDDGRQGVHVRCVAALRAARARPRRRRRERRRLAQIEAARDGVRRLDGGSFRFWDDVGYHDLAK